MSKAWRYGRSAIAIQQGGDGVAQGCECLRCINEADLGAILAKADISQLVVDIFDGSVSAAELVSLSQGDALAVEAGDEILDRN